MNDIQIFTTPILDGVKIRQYKGIVIVRNVRAINIIRDFFTGLFIILENQYRVGDVVCVDTVCGTVEDINLRMTILRDVDGAVHHIPNGEIKIATNKTKGFARVNLIIGIAYDADIEKVKGVVNRVGQDMAQDPEWKDKIIKAPEFVRVDNFSNFR